VLNKEYKSLHQFILEADATTASPAFRKKPYTLQYETSGKDSTMLNFLGVDYTVEKSDLSGGDWFKYSKTPKNFSLPFFNTLKSKSIAIIPEAYIIPPEWKTVIEKLRLHGIQMQVLNRETRLKTEGYKFKTYKFRASPYEGHQTVDVELESFSQEIAYPAGSVIVQTNQASAKLIAQLLEPKAPSSLLWWGYFNTIFEQKEYAESYVMEPMAREMIKNDSTLLKTLEEKKKAEPEFASHPFEILNWFYRQTPWWDNHKDIYPVGRILDAGELNKILLCSIKSNNRSVPTCMPSKGSSAKPYRAKWRCWISSCVMSSNERGNRCGRFSSSSAQRCVEA
jgi:hypothetical protein